MRYPIWMFIFAFVMPPFAAHALLTGAARIVPVEQRVTVVRLAGESCASRRHRIRSPLNGSSSVVHISHFAGAACL